jgi:hypothetical protein
MRLATLGMLVAAQLAAAASMAMARCGASQTPSELVRVRAALASGQALLDSGQFARAKPAFDLAIARGALLEPRERASAHFGRAVALQELVRAAEDDSGGAASVDSALSDYRAAWTLDPARYHVAARYNAALLRGQRGEHDTASVYLLEVSRAMPPAQRTRALTRAARELEAGAAGEDSASLTALWLALRDEASRVGAGSPADSSAELTELRLALARRPVGGVSEWTPRWLSTLANDSARAPEVAEGAIATLGRIAPGNVPAADSLLLILARANVTARLSPETFAQTQRPSLERLAGQHPRLREPLAWLIEVYGGDARHPGGLASAPGGWWGQSPEHQRAWSSTLRTVGQWLERAGRDSAAERYYLAALGGLQSGLVPPWADWEAALPLIFIYDRWAQGSQDAARQLARLLDALFEGKGAAYREQDLVRIRQMHTTLGAYYASRGQWEGAPRGALFQLERMRLMTQRLRTPEQTLVDPPELLEQLITGYLATGQAGAALRVLPDLRAANAASGRPDDSAAWEARIRSHPPGAGSR